MRYLLSALAVAVLLMLALSVPPATSHGLGTGSNNWDMKSYGWPLEVWSRSVHTYRAQDSNEWIVVSRKYSVHWGETAVLYASLVPVARGIVVFLRASRRQ